MTPAQVLTRARAHVAGGWSQPFSVDAHGRMCPATDEGVVRFCVQDALALAAGSDVDALMAALAHVERQLAAVHGLHDVTQWLDAPRREHHEVLELLSRAERHAHAEETR